MKRFSFEVALLALCSWIFMLCEGSVVGDLGGPTLSYWQAIVSVLGIGAAVEYGTVSLLFNQMFGGRR